MEAWSNIVKAFRLVIVAGLISTIHCQLIPPPELAAVIPALHLKDGRVLAHVRIVAFADKTVMAKWDGGMGTIAYVILPDSIRALAESQRPPAQSPAEVAAIKARAEVAAASEKRVPVIQIQSNQESIDILNATRDKAVKEAAQKKAEHYFRYEYLAYMPNVVIEHLDADLGNAREVSGWTGRYEIEGKCSLEYYDSVNATLDKKVAAGFTVTVEWDGTEAKVVDFQNHVSS